MNGQLVIGSFFEQSKATFPELVRNLKLKLLFGHFEHDASRLIFSKPKTNPELGTKAESDPENGDKTSIEDGDLGD